MPIKVTPVTVAFVHWGCCLCQPCVLSSHQNIHQLNHTIAVADFEVEALDPLRISNPSMHQIQSKRTRFSLKNQIQSKSMFFMGICSYIDHLEVHALHFKVHCIQQVILKTLTLHFHSSLPKFKFAPANRCIIKLFLVLISIVFVVPCDTKFWREKTLAKWLTAIIGR